MEDEELPTTYSGDGPLLVGVEEYRGETNKKWEREGVVPDDKNLALDWACPGSFEIVVRTGIDLIAVEKAKTRDSNVRVRR